MGVLVLRGCLAGRGGRCHSEVCVWVHVPGDGAGLGQMCG